MIEITLAERQRIADFMEVCNVGYASFASHADYEDTIMCISRYAKTVWGDLPAGTGLVDDGVWLIAKERIRQQAKEGYNSEHDAKHEFGELALAACAYAFPNSTFEPLDDSQSFDTNVFIRIKRRAFWPFHYLEYKPEGDRIKELVKAGALICAEIDRLQKVKPF
jgi:hypothetical protein